MKEILMSDEEIYPARADFELLSKKTKELLLLLKKGLSSNRLKAEAFIGGSYAKGTLSRQKEYDIDVFVRFSEEINIEKLERIVKDISKKMNIKYERVHGSRDYFFVEASDNLIFEIVPVKKIKKQIEAENSTDLSYFHVNYINKKLKNKKLIKEILLAKSFFKASEVYGAESWIHGFSGYSLECLIIYYKSLDKMLREFIKAYDKKQLPIIIDIEKQYKNKQEVMININESKRQGPIVFVDPTWKERNVLGALTNESFEKLIEISKKYLKRPSKDYFVKKEFNKESFIELAKKKDAKLIELELETNKQAGDIAGAKLIKGSKFILSILEKRCDILAQKTVYNLGQDAKLYIVLQEKKNAEQKGPSIKMDKHATAFKEEHPEAYQKKGHLYYKMKSIGNIHDYVKNELKKYNKSLNEMDIIKVEVGN